jgi:hypothetical protein
MYQENAKYYFTVMPLLNEKTFLALQYAKDFFIWSYHPFREKKNTTHATR